MKYYFIIICVYGYVYDIILRPHVLIKLLYHVLIFSQCLLILRIMKMSFFLVTCTSVYFVFVYIICDAIKHLEQRYFFIIYFYIWLIFYFNKK